VWGALKLIQRIRAEPGRQKTFGTFWAEESASGESSFSAIHKIIASVYKTIASVSMEKIAKWRQISTGDVGTTNVLLL